jgi:hypothetical protein
MGARVMVLLGQVRSGRDTGVNGLYFSDGFFNMVFSFGGAKRQTRGLNPAE